MMQDWASASILIDPCWWKGVCGQGSYAKRNMDADGPDDSTCWRSYKSWLASKTKLIRYEDNRNSRWKTTETGWIKGKKDWTVDRQSTWTERKTLYRNVLGISKCENEGENRSGIAHKTWIQPYVNLLTSGGNAERVWSPGYYMCSNNNIKLRKVVQWA